MKKDKNYEAKKHDMSVKSMYFSRYLMIRYFSAAYLFVNLFWLIFALCYRDYFATIIAGGLTGLMIIASIEQASKWHDKSTKLKYTKLFYQIQVIFNLIAVILCYSPFGKVLFPFIATKEVADIIFTILLLGIGGCLIVLRRIFNIQHGRDRYLRAIKTFENNRQ